ncbi:MAG: glycan-binding surface protein [Dysgonamonadaceae bacterium]|jgi:hypothetical protein|nr:glycan-binding surface protein [Dysgonamonadaceae bacterium]
MKNKIYKSFWTWFIFIGLSFVTMLLNSCKDEENEGINTPVTITKVYLEDAQSSVPDRDLSQYGNFARLGQTIRLEGSGFIGVKKLYINGYDTYINPVFITNNSMLVNISRDVPTIDAPEDVRNTIRIEKSASNFLIYNFEIRAAAPTITRVSHTMPQAGDQITIYGTGLYEAANVTFPGNIVVTDGITTNEEGTEVTVTVPERITESGSLLVIAANGGAYSPAYFNYKAGVVHDFDDVQNYSWGSGIDNTALTSVIPINAGPQSQGGYQVFNSSGNQAASADQRFWLNSSAIFEVITNYISGSTSAADCGIQMDIYVEGAWNSGVIRFVMADGSGSNRYCMLYQPVYINGAYDETGFENPGCWFTITLPFSLSDDYDGKTLDDVVASMSAASYKQAGPWFENSGIKDVFEPVPATEKIYFDNIRFVPLNTPTYSDFPDEE